MSRFREYCPLVFYIHDTLYDKYLNYERIKAFPKQKRT